MERKKEKFFLLLSLLCIHLGGRLDLISCWTNERSIDWLATTQILQSDDNNATADASEPFLLIRSSKTNIQLMRASDPASWIFFLRISNTIQSDTLASRLLFYCQLSSSGSERAREMQPEIHLMNQILFLGSINSIPARRSCWLKSFRNSLSDIFSCKLSQQWLTRLSQSDIEFWILKKCLSPFFMRLTDWMTLDLREKEKEK